MDGTRQEKVQLGCGTLILIALIVIIFSGNNQRGIREMNAKLDAIGRRLEAIEQRLGAPGAATPGGAPAAAEPARDDAGTTVQFLP